MKSKRQRFYQWSQIKRRSRRSYDVFYVVNWVAVEFRRSIYCGLLDECVYDLQQFSEVRNVTVEYVQLFSKLTRNKLIVVLRANTIPFDTPNYRVASAKTEAVRLIQN